MYETGNQKDRDRKCIILRDPRCQRSRNEAHSMAQCAKCTGFRDCICRTVPCHRSRCRTRGINLNIVAKQTQRPAGRCCFYRRFVYFNIIFLRGTDDSHIYQSAMEPDTYCMRDIFAHHYVSIGLNTEQYLTELFSQPAGTISLPFNT